MDLAHLANRLPELPDRTVSYYDDGRLAHRSYPEVAADVAAVEARLGRIGVEPGMRIGVLSENCYAWILYELALLRLRCVLVALPQEEFASHALDEVADRYGLHLVFLSERERASRSETREWIVRLDGEDDGRPRQPDLELSPLDPDVFTLVFSSGTSGRLKCLLMSKCGTEAIIEAYGRHYTFRSDDAILAVLPLSAFQQRLMVYAAIHHGFDLLVAEPARLFHALKEMRPTILAGPPLFYEMVESRFRSLPRTKRLALTVLGRAIHASTFGRVRTFLMRRTFAPFHVAFGGRIRLMLTGSAPSRLSTLALFDLIGLPLYQAYGLTETMFVSWNLPGANRPGSVGRLVFPGSVSIADDGEIIVTSEHPQSLGYFDADEAEARRTYLGDNRIATGDVGRFDEDGYLYIVGRKKEIIVTQAGYKVQPESLEQEIERAAQVARAIVFGGGELPGLVSLVSLRSGDPASERSVEDLVESLNRRLPSPSRIARVVFTTTEFRVDNGFLTRNLKVDRRAIYAAFRNTLLPTGPS